MEEQNLTTIKYITFLAIIFLVVYVIIINPTVINKVLKSVEYGELK